MSTIYSTGKGPICPGFCYRCEATNLLKAMILGHTLDPTPEQAAHFRPACGTARFAYNWGLAEWQRMREAGEKPSTAAVKCRWNAHRKAELPWTSEVTKCAGGQAIMALGTAFANFLRDCKKPRQQRRFRYPRFKNKARNDSFARWNDQFAMSGKPVRIAKLGFARRREELRFVGKIMGATVSFSSGRWFISVQVNTDEERVAVPKGTVCGVDARLANIDAAHKLTTDLSRRFETIVSEDLNVSGMAKNHSLAGAVLDCGFDEIRRQFQYKQAMRGGRVVVAARFYPSTQICSCCGCLTGPQGREEMHVEEWICSECGAEPTRDSDAAINLKKLGTAAADSTRGDMTPLPAVLRMSASVAGEPRTEIERTFRKAGTPNSIENCRNSNTAVTDGFSLSR